MLLQRTLAVELQRLSIQFRKQQKAYLNRLRSKDGGGGAGGGGSGGLNLLEDGSRGRQDDDYDPGFSDMQACWGGEQAGQRKSRSCSCRRCSWAPAPGLMCFYPHRVSPAWSLLLPTTLACSHATSVPACAGPQGRHHDQPD